MKSKKRSIRNILNEENPKFFNWLKKILEFDVSRTLQISTYLVNFYIAMNYFPRVTELFQMIPELVPENVDIRRIKEFNINLERMYSIFILISLTYDWKSKHSKGKTDIKIDELSEYGPLVLNFFSLNLIPKRLRVMNLEDVSKSINDYLLIENFLPNLRFDLEFQKVLSSDAIRHLFYTSSPRNLLNKDGAAENLKYVPEEYLLLEYMEEKKDYFKKLFKMSSELRISKNFLSHLNYSGIFDFGNFNFIDELIDVFIIYYIKRIPSKEKDIRDNLLCYSVLFKITEGKLYQELNWSRVVDRMEQIVSSEVVTEFMNQYILQFQNLDFYESFHRFDGQEFLQDYHDFLKFAGYYHFGIVRTGAYLIWRSLIKYLESLQQGEEFWKKKGMLLEKWCYDQAVEYGFTPEKIILINPNRKPTSRYREMRKQIKSFPKLPLIFQVKVPKKEYDFCFREFDFVFKINNQLFLFECKGTSAPIAEEGKFIKWISNFQYAIEKFTEKFLILRYNVQNNLIKHQIFEGVEDYVLNIIKTEGIFSKYCELTTGEYIQYLKDLRKSLDEDNFESFLDKRTQPI